jgi:hypothetical protein
MPTDFRNTTLRVKLFNLDRTLRDRIKTSDPALKLTPANALRAYKAAIDQEFSTRSRNFLVDASQRAWLGVLLTFLGVATSSSIIWILATVAIKWSPVEQPSSEALFMSIALFSCWFPLMGYSAWYDYFGDPEYPYPPFPIALATLGVGAILAWLTQQRSRPTILVSWVLLGVTTLVGLLKEFKVLPFEKIAETVTELRGIYLTSIYALLFVLFAVLFYRIYVSHDDQPSGGPAPLVESEVETD